LGDVALECTEQDLVTFSPPSGQTCFEYAAAFLDATDGYLTNPNATAACSYCQSTSGADYIKNLGYSNDTKWRDWGIFIVFNVSTIALVYFATWFFKIRPLYKK
jgi:ABC-type multidrug transport system permease subunit